MKYEFVVEDYNHADPHDGGADLVLHIANIKGVIRANTLARINIEASEYKFEVVSLEKNRKLRESLSSIDEYGAIGVKFISPEECVYPWDSFVWANLFPGKRVKCLSITY